MRNSFVCRFVCALGGFLILSPVFSLCEPDSHACVLRFFSLGAIRQFGDLFVRFLIFFFSLMRPQIFFGEVGPVPRAYKFPQLGPMPARRKRCVSVAVASFSYLRLLLETNFAPSRYTPPLEIAFKSAPQLDDLSLSSLLIHRSPAAHKISLMPNLTPRLIPDGITSARRQSRCQTGCGVWASELPMGQRSYVFF